MISASTAGAEQQGKTAQTAPLVSVIIPCYNHAHFLGEAVESVLCQKYSPLQIVVVDDGSTDDTSEVAARYPEVQYVKQKNSGLSAARNAGFARSAGEYLVFLDADDRLTSGALEAGVACFREHPECGFVFGSFRRIASDGSVLGRADSPQTADDPYRSMLVRNYIAMHATVMYRRAALESVAGFDEDLPACEDYDIYLRMVRRFPVQSYNKVVADYRQHSTNMSGNSELILASALKALARQWNHVKSDRELRAAYDAGIEFWTRTYGQEHLWPAAHLRMHGAPGQFAEAAGTLLRYAPRWFIGRASMQLLHNFYHLLKPTIPSSIRHRLQARWPDLKRKFPPSVGHVRFGDLRRTSPIDPWFGYQRGTPIDRYYIEKFLARNAGDVHGRVLEVKDNAYTRRFGGDAVERRDVLDVDEGNPDATIRSDLSRGDDIPSEAFDCFLLTQTLQLIYDLEGAVATSYRLLKPGGVLLVTVPGITKIDQGSTWYWTFTAASARKLLEAAFPSSRVTVESYGNVLAAQGFLQGLAAEELETVELDEHDPDYPVAIVVKAVKPEREE